MSLGKYNGTGCRNGNGCDRTAPAQGARYHTMPDHRRSGEDARGAGEGCERWTQPLMTTRGRRRKQSFERPAAWHVCTTCGGGWGARDRGRDIQGKLCQWKSGGGGGVIFGGLRLRCIRNDLETSDDHSTQCKEAPWPEPEQMQVRLCPLCTLLIHRPRMPRMPERVVNAAQRRRRGGGTWVTSL